mmetsp:Transcript_27807/g.86568  ORF Transcript_27807/g.86568 Transcript_27807/m.86568 type:complete len:191 (-) Transcript_27807:18-590(-)
MAEAVGVCRRRFMATPGVEATDAWGYLYPGIANGVGGPMTPREARLLASPQRWPPQLNPNAQDFSPMDGGCAPSPAIQEKLGERLPVMLSGRQRSRGGLLPEDLAGSWMDSLGNFVEVCITDAYETKLVAHLSQPPRQDIMLSMRPLPGGGWLCGNSMLDPEWTTASQLHWLTVDGRVSVWARLPDDGAA